MPVKRTSLDAFLEMKDSGQLGEQQKQVLRAYRRFGPCTRREIVKHTDLMYNAVSGRTNDLLGEGLLEIKGEDINPDTNRKAELIGLVDND